MAIMKKTLEFKNCARCGRQPEVKMWHDKWSVECQCGLGIPGMRSEEDCQRSWNYHVDRKLAEIAAEKAEAEKKQKRGRKKCESTES